jgi:hypothetical protein
VHDLDCTMKKRLVVLLAVLVLATISYVVWTKWISTSTPSSVLTHSLMQANAGDYEAACESLPTGQRQLLLNDPNLMKDVWDCVTKNRTIDSIVVDREDRGITGNFGDVDLSIKYKDGTRRTATIKISCLHSRWSFGVREIYNSFLAQDRKEAVKEFERRTISLAKEFSRVGKSGAMLRIPESLIWDDRKQAYDHPELNILIEPDSRPGSGFSSLVRIAEKDWSSPQFVLEKRTDLSTDKVKATLFDGDMINTKGRGWRSMYLVIGDEHRAAMIRSVFPNLENFRRAMRECLTTARWAPDKSG